MLSYLHPALLGAQSQYLHDVVAWLIGAGMRDVLFSVEPEQEMGFRSQYAEAGLRYLHYERSRRMRPS